METPTLEITAPDEVGRALEILHNDFKRLRIKLDNIGIQAMDDLDNLTKYVNTKHS